MVHYSARVTGQSMILLRDGVELELAIAIVTERLLVLDSRAGAFRSWRQSRRTTNVLNVSALRTRARALRWLGTDPRLCERLCLGGGGDAGNGSEHEDWSGNGDGGGGRDGDGDGDELLLLLRWERRCCLLDVVRWLIVGPSGPRAMFDDGTQVRCGSG